VTKDFYRNRKCHNLETQECVQGFTTASCSKTAKTVPKNIDPASPLAFLENRKQRYGRGIGKARLWSG
jgi:hypothetical protein